MSRRGTNIYKRKDGRWEGRIKKEGLPEGVRRYRSIYGKTYAEVKKRMETARAEERWNRAPEKYTVEEAVILWLKERKPYWKQSTYSTYRNMADKYILPGLGNVRINGMDERIMEAFLADIRREKQLSAGYLHSICSVVIRAMKYMKKRHHYEIRIPDNLIPAGRYGERMLPGETELAALEAYLVRQAGEGDSTCLGILIALCTGLRIGETCALTWEDIDLKEGILSVHKNLQRVKAQDGKKSSTEILFQTPKTGTSRRRIPIPPVLMPLLKAAAKTDNSYIIPGKKKPWAEPRTLQYRFARILSRCGLEAFNFHMLRHAFATRCIAGGFDVKSLSEILGHSSIQITLNLYVHSSMERKKQLMEQFGLCLYPAAPSFH